MFFFFSSRRRHTRYWRDWSSDVCSSDLKRLIVDFAASGRRREWSGSSGGTPEESMGPGHRGRTARAAAQIGRAPGRERGEISVVAVSLKKKKSKRTNADHTSLSKHPIPR